MTGFPQAQLGILAFGTTHHAHLEIDRHPHLPPHALAAVVRVVENTVLTGAGCTVVVGFRPEVWRELAPNACPDGLRGYDEAVVGDDGFSMPATQHDVILWVGRRQSRRGLRRGDRGGARLADVASVVEESEGWTYQHHRDLTGFEDGTENPPLVETPSIALVPAGRPGAGGTLDLYESWVNSLVSFLEG
jgi:putative iron-dependent peroxidase